MMDYKIDYNDEDFFNRLWGVLGKETQQWWANKISVSQGTISNCYKKKHMATEKIIKILTVKQISPTWLIFGIGPKELRFFDENKIDEIQDDYRNVQNKLAEMEYENVRLKKTIKELKNVIDQSTLMVSKSEEEFNFLGILTVLRMATDVIFKMAEVYSKQNIDSHKYGEILSWMKKNIDAHKHSTLKVLEQLDKVIK